MPSASNPLASRIRIVDYPSLYPDVPGDPHSIPPPISQTAANTEADVQATTGIASSAPAPSGSGPPRSYAQETQELVDLCLAFLDQIQRGAAPWVVQRLNRLNNIYGPMPTDPAHFSFWMAMVSIIILSLIFGRCERTRSPAPSLIVKKKKNPLTGPAHRRYGKSQTFAGEIAATSPPLGRALD